MKLAFSIAKRFLSSSKSQTILIVLGIAIGVSVQVFIGSLIAGLQNSLLDTTIGSSSQVTILPKDNTAKISDYDTIINKVMKSEKSIIEMTPTATASGFVRTGDNTYPILMRGFPLDKANGIYKFDTALTKGALPKENEVILGKDLAEEAGVRVGDQIEILTPLGIPTKVTISGIYDLKVSNINSSWIISEMPLVQTIFDFGDTATSIEMQVSDVFAADTVGKGVEKAIDSKTLKVTNWKVENASLLSGLSGQSTSSLMIQVFVMIAVILGISSVLAISVVQKSRQLGILKAMGIKNKTASLIFLFQGLILGVFGAILGVAFGLGLAAAFTKFAVNPDGTPVVALYIDPKFILISGLIAIAAATLASLIPARRSSKLDPMEVIKNG